MNTFKLFLAGASALALSTSVNATDLEVTHWWTSGGEAAAVAEFAKAFDATGNKWVDGAIAGGGGTARPIMISRITGGDPMAATQFNHGQQALELVEAGLMLDLTDVAEAEGWKDVIFPQSLLDSCTVDGRIYCAPVNIHSPEWLWLSNKAFEDAGVPVPTNWDEYVAAAPQLRSGWQDPAACARSISPGSPTSLFGAVQIGVGGLDTCGSRSMSKRTSMLPSWPEMAKVFQAAWPMPARWLMARTCRTGTRQPTW
jgi:glucose/mannose transport system substrate-binding protein